MSFVAVTLLACLFTAVLFLPVSCWVLLIMNCIYTCTFLVGYWCVAFTFQLNGIFKKSIWLVLQLRWMQYIYNMDIMELCRRRTWREIYFRLWLSGLTCWVVIQWKQLVFQHVLEMWINTCSSYLYPTNVLKDKAVCWYSSNGTHTFSEGKRLHFATKSIPFTLYKKCRK